MFCNMGKRSERRSHNIERSSEMTDSKTAFRVAQPHRRAIKPLALVVARCGQQAAAAAWHDCQIMPLHAGGQRPRKKDPESCPPIWLEDWEALAEPICDCHNERGDRNAPLRCARPSAIVASTLTVEQRIGRSISVASQEAATFGSFPFVINNKRAFNRVVVKNNPYQTPSWMLV